MQDGELVSFDYAIKYLLKDKADYDVVEGFISAIISSNGYPPVKIKAQLESESNKEEPEMKRSLADLIVSDEKGAMYIVEIDRSHTDFFLHKACFNTSRLIVDSIASGTDYSQIKKVIHINLIHFPFPYYREAKAPIHHGKTIFHEVDKDNPQDIHLTDMSHRFFDVNHIFPEYFVVSAPLFDDKIKNETDEWLYIMKHSAIKEDFKSPYMKKFAERFNILRMTPEEQAEYREHTSKTLKDRDYLVTAKAEGREEGRVEGEAKGIEKTALNMLRENLDIKLISQVTGLSAEEITKLKNRL